MGWISVSVSVKHTEIMQSIHLKSHLLNEMNKNWYDLPDRLVFEVEDEEKEGWYKSNESEYASQYKHPGVHLVGILLQSKAGNPTIHHSLFYKWWHPKN